MPYPDWKAGQTITAGLLRAAQPLVVRKTANTSRNSTTTTTADPELFLPVEANAVYLMDGHLIYSAPTAGDINLDFTVPTGTTGSWSTIAPPTTEATDGGVVRLIENNVDQARSYGGVVNSSTKIVAQLTGLVITSSTAGDYTLTWAQATSDPANTTVYAESWIRLTRAE